MKNKSYLEEGIRITTELLDDIIFLCETRMKKTYFTRRGRNKMDFKSMLLFIINFVKKSIQIELDEFFKMITGKDINVTKQAFSEARQKISPKAFIKMADTIIKWFYTDTDFKKYRGYRVLSIDGTGKLGHTSLATGSDPWKKMENCHNNKMAVLFLCYNFVRILIHLRRLEVN